MKAKKSIAVPLDIKLIKKNPHKIYRANITEDHHIKEICKFLRNHNDKILEVILNNKSIKFDSMSSRKRFASGFQLASTIISKQTKDLYNNMQYQVSDIANKWSKEKQKRIEYGDKLRLNSTVSKLRIETWKDNANEWEENCKVLEDQLKLLEKKMIK